MPKCDINKVARQLYGNHTSTWVFSCKFATYFQNTFSQEHRWRAASETTRIKFSKLQRLAIGLIELMKYFNFLKTCLSPEMSVSFFRDELIVSTFLRHSNNSIQKL